MSILLSGDFHANSKKELDIITKEALIENYQQEKFDSIKYHIILGDAGFMWHGNYKEDVLNFKELALRPFPILSVIGNHEPVLGMKDVPEVDIGIGEPVLQIYDKPFTAYLKRGKVYNIDGFKFLVLGGALSIDKHLRRVGISWWENEYWSTEEKRDLFKLLETENAFDYVISHTAPSRVIAEIFSRLKGYLPNFFDEVAALNERIDGMVTCKQWFCGHWHNDIYHYDENMQRGYQFLYKKTALMTHNGSIGGNSPGEILIV
ncbi:MAG: metallophosphoesterase [Treponema sp.]|jgi:3-oxoacid CoA-transferase subunit A|nr:metallophosphoesterase [Treponema sp.]